MAGTETRLLDIATERSFSSRVTICLVCLELSQFMPIVPALLSLVPPSI